jgi:hypothetical protein
MKERPKWSQPRPIAPYFGSAGRGLGFYHIDLPELDTARWLNISNCGIVVIKRGQISMVELEKSSLTSFAKNGLGKLES